MATRSFPSVTDQVAERLRQGMMEGRWKGFLPGRKQLAEYLGCSQWTVEEAAQRLTKEGLLVSQGAGRRRRIVLSGEGIKPRALQVKLLLYEASDRMSGYILELVHRLQHAGHEAAFAEKTMHDLGMDVSRIARFAGGSDVDAWVVISGPQDVLEWFAGQETPAFALFGRLTRIPLASTKPDKGGAMRELVDRLVDLGHRRIVMLVREERRKPGPGLVEQLFLDQLEERGIPTGPYNLPDWGDRPIEFHRMLDSLFEYTPPTALIVDQPVLCVAVLQHLASLGIKAPDDVSLACTDLSESFEWCVPSITHITWESRPFINRVVKWANNISRGKDDRRKSSTKASLVVGGTIGPAKEG
ncbi:substrate-binding domain-containing protein [Haloferula sp. A504]|uniref:substrate-binding domain-containing protein n=1 Tax=Haloferula sp. A504 TaxID=3373601 RepID=UPI0031BC8858|nr:substrate-binding domain-containing protein [Verrucomicrobiaceae bacterium E54]